MLFFLIAEFRHALFYNILVHAYQFLTKSGYQISQNREHIFIFKNIVGCINL